jgi:hypothetical protein
METLIATGLADYTSLRVSLPESFRLMLGNTKYLLINSISRLKFSNRFILKLLLNLM